MHCRFFLLLIFAAIAISGCTEQVQKPTVSVSDITVTGITLQTLNLDTYIIIDNPNPVSANLTKIAVDLYYLQNNQSRYLGHGERYNVEVRNQGQTTVTVPVVINNQQTVGAVIEAGRKGAITIKASGSASLDMNVTTFEIPFEYSRQIVIPTLSR